jgi:predicted dehydrogenase
MTDERPRFGLIGTGIWVRAVQAPALARSTAVRFTSILGRNEAATGAIAAAHGVTPYADLGSFLDSVDIVGIALPPDVQPDFALAAIAAGKHVLLEKPVATDPAAADAIVAALEERGLASLVFFTHLLIPRVRSWLDEAIATGGWISARIEGFSRVFVDPSSPYHSSAWRSKGGALWDSTPHAVAVLTTVLGPADAVSGLRGQGDLTQVTLHHRSGAISSITATMDAPAALPGETAFFGSAGKLTLPPSPNWNLEAEGAYGVALTALADAAAGKPGVQRPDARFGAHVTKILAAAEQSMANGRRIPLS